MANQTKTSWLEGLIKDLEGREYHRRVKQLAREPSKLRKELKAVREQRNLAMLAIAQRDIMQKQVKEVLVVVYSTTEDSNQMQLNEAIEEIREILEERDDKAETPPAPVGKDS